MYPTPKLNPKAKQPAFHRITWRGLYGQDSVVYPAEQTGAALHYLKNHTDAQIVSVTAAD